MTRVDLITGFLGAGKTTFIRRYLRWLEPGRALIIENEFGSVGVDATLLRDEHCEIEDLSGVCMCCKGRGQFVAMLRDAAARGCPRVLVEPSGIYDVDEFFSTMDEVADCCAVGSVLTIVDARRPEGLSPESEYLMFTQLMAAGTVVLSKTQHQTQQAIDETTDWLNALIAAHGGDRTLGEDVCVKDWDALTDADLAALAASGCHRDSHPRHAARHEDVYASCMLLSYVKDEDDLRGRVTRLFNDPACGRVLRVKGCLRDLDKNLYEVNCTPGELSVRPAPDLRRGLLVVIGQDLNEDALNGAFLPKPR